MIEKLGLFLIPVTLLGVLGCATMFGEKNKTVRVITNPSAADIKINGADAGFSPIDIDLSWSERWGGGLISIEKEGYKTATRRINTDFQLVGLWNILNFPIGFIIDAATANMMKLQQKEIKVNLNK